MTSPDARVLNDDWSDLSRIRPLPEVDQARLHGYRVSFGGSQSDRHDGFAAPAALAAVGIASLRTCLTPAKLSRVEPAASCLKERR